MKNKTFYIMSDTDHESIQKITKNLTELGFTVQRTLTSARDLKFEKGKQIHFAINPSPAMDMDGVRTAVEQCIETNSFLYIFGDLDLLLPEQAAYLSRFPSTRFSTFPIDFELLEKAIEYNLREKKTILVVDDDPILLRSIKSWIGLEFDVSLVTSGQDAIDFLSNKPTDLVLLDCRMPDMDGMETLRRLRMSKKTANIPVIFLTAKNDRDSVMRALKLKPQGYILKQEKPQVIRESVVHFFKTRIIQM